MRFSKVRRQYLSVVVGKRAIIEDNNAPFAKLGVQRFDRDQIGQQHPRADHRKQDQPVVGWNDRRCIQHGARRGGVRAFLPQPVEFVRDPVHGAAVTRTTSHW